jgi:hypothetical protein
LARQRPTLGTPFGADGPWLQAIVDALGDLHDLIDERLPQQEGPVPVAEPAPTAKPETTVPVSEPAPDGPPEKADPVEEPDPADDPDKPDDQQQLPEPPPHAGRGSSTAAWSEWATAVGVTVTDGMTRDDIITACRNAGVIE